MQNGITARVMVADRSYVRPRLVNLAMDDALGIKLDGRRMHGARLEIEFENIAGFNQLGRARARQQIAPGLVRMTQADMPEGVDHAFMGEDAIGDGKLVAQVGEFVRHGVLSGRIWSGCWLRQENIRHIAGLHGKHVLAGHDPAAAAACDFEKRRDDGLGHEVDHESRRIEPRGIDRQGIGGLHAERRCIDDEFVIARNEGTARHHGWRPKGKAMHQVGATPGINVHDEKPCHFCLDQRQRDRGPGAAGSDHERAPAAGVAAGGPQGRNRGGAIRHVAAPSAAAPADPAVDPMQQIGGAEQAGALGRLVAMAKRREFVGNREDEAVNVLHGLGGMHEAIEIVCRYMERNADRVDLAGGEFASEALRRASLADRVAEDEMKACFAVEGGQHQKRR
jgi:hypothetical protein